jgi:two-component system sensor histidine kinase YesM
MKEAFAGWFNALGFKERLRVFFVVVTIIPILLIGAILLYISSNTILEKNIQRSYSRLDFIRYRAAEIISTQHRDTLILAYKPSIRRYAEQYRKTTGPDRELLESQVKSMLMSFYDRQRYASVRLVNMDGNALYYSRLPYAGVRELFSPELIPPMDAFRIFDHWGDTSFEYGEPIIPYIRIVLGEKNHRPEAFLIINIRESLFGQLYRDYETLPGVEYFIVKENGTIQSCHDREKIGGRLSDVAGLDISQFAPGHGYFKARVNGKNYVISYLREGPDALAFMELTPSHIIDGGFVSTVSTTVIFAFFTFFICLPVSSALGKKITQPLYNLVEKVNAIGPQNIAKSGEAKNELALLNEKYEEILERLESAIGEAYDAQNRIKEAEMRALMAQINPHFLFNTLSVIIWLVDRGEGGKAIDAIKNLSDFLRASISDGRGMITIGEELRHAAIYTNIQKIRYEERIQVDYDVDPEITDFYVPRLILQPLIENAVHHGMSADGTDVLKVAIKGWGEDGEIVFEVRDNGKKTDARKLGALNDYLLSGRRDAAQKGRGIGSANVHDRLRAFFGENCGLSYRRDGEETVASVRIKATGRGDG